MSAMNPLTAESSDRRDAIDREAAAWTVRRERGLAAEEAVALARWLAADPAHGETLERFRQVSTALDELPPAGVAALRGAVAPSATAGARPDVRLQARRRPWFPRLATALAVAALAAVTWLGVDHLLAQPSYAQPFATARGLQMSQRLPDGSELQLDTATRLQVSLYRDRREVRLEEGEAMFSVQRDPERPFHVLAGGTRVTVLGTRFAVRRTEEGVKVAVEEGRVRVAAGAADADGVMASGAAGGGRLVELGAGETVSASGDGSLGPVAKVPPRGVAPWREGRVVFDDTPLGEALAEFARYGDLPVVVRDPAVAALRITGSFEIARAASFAAALPKVLPVKLVARGARTEIVAR